MGVVSEELTRAGTMSTLDFLSLHLSQALHTRLRTWLSLSRGGVGKLCADMALGMEVRWSCASFEQAELGKLCRHVTYSSWLMVAKG